jgi:hypothetical protein
MAIPTNQAGHEDVFTKVHDSFLGGLSPEHRLRVLSCTSSASLLEGVRDLDIIHKNRQRGNKYLSGLKRLSENLTPYFRVIDLFVNSNPEYASLAWGGINLVLQV